MRTVLLAMLTRRQGLSFQLKTAGYELIGTMNLSTATSRHEMEISETDFLRHSKELARICAVPGMGWYVVEFRQNDDGETDIFPRAASIDMKHYETATAEATGDEKRTIPINDIERIDRELSKASTQIEAIPDDLPTKFFALRKIAKDIGLDVTKINGCAAMKEAIRAARATLAA